MFWLTRHTAKIPQDCESFATFGDPISVNEDASNRNCTDFERDGYRCVPFYGCKGQLFLEHFSFRWIFIPFFLLLNWQSKNDLMQVDLFRWWNNHKWAWYRRHQEKKFCAFRFKVFGNFGNLLQTSRLERCSIGDLCWNRESSSWMWRRLLR